MEDVMKIETFIETNIPTVQIIDSYERILATLVQSPVKTVPVLEGDCFVGVIEYSVLLTSGSTDISNIIKPCTVVDGDLSIHELPFFEGPILPVLGGGKTYIGCVTASTVVKFLLSELQQLNTIFENGYDGILVTDANGNILRVNQALEKLSTLTREAYIGRNLADIINNEIFRKPSVTLRALKEKRQITDFQQYKTGVDVLVTATPVFDEEHNLVRVLANVHDITELLKLKRQLEKSELLNSKYYTELLELRQQNVKDGIIAASPQMKEVIELATHIGQTDSIVLLLGESGVGKEVVARKLHENSKRKETGAFIKVNCGAIPHDLLESEFFGYAPGAFTGAQKGGKPGLFELADEGTLFLDEIGELPLQMQTKLLRVLQDQQFSRVGGIEVLQVNVRIIAATNRDLKTMVEKGEFREDLYYRLNVIPITIPPLRERKEDIPPLVGYFLQKFNHKYNQERYISARAMDKLLQHAWPGNVRELSNMIERLVLTGKESIIHPEDIPFHNMQSGFSISEVIEIRSYLEGNMFEFVERKLIETVLEKEGSIRKAAKKIGVSHTTLIRKMKKHNLQINKINR
jgi:PAS domain S-box-containing protein